MQSITYFLLNLFRSTLDYSQEREELRLRCQERKLQRQAEVIRGALNELGCEELPSGCDLSMEGSFSEPIIKVIIS